MKTVNNLNLEAIQKILSDANLPYADISEEKLKHFIGIEKNDNLIGLVGLEVFPPYALLRSLAVAESLRGQGLGIKLLTQIEKLAKENKIKDIYLLTTTAEKFFAKHSYKEIARDAAPAVIKATSEYCDVCPASATVMKKRL